ncbi:MAG TPA: DUF1778 domain-containing protein [Planctomycetaceae bacterium]|nr:DUF1778 domain-containing protein [Planctomycetaceae bacterium]
MTAMTMTRQTDPRARVSLPKDFASTKVIIERVGDGELRIRLAEVDDETPVTFLEEVPRRLSVRDTKRLIELLENPPPPNAALKKAIKEYRQYRQSLRRPRRGDSRKR